MGYGGLTSLCRQSADCSSDLVVHHVLTNKNQEKVKHHVSQELLQIMQLGGEVREVDVVLNQAALRIELVVTKQGIDPCLNKIASSKHSKLNDSR